MSMTTHTPSLTAQGSAQSYLPETTAAFGPPQTDAAGFWATLNTDPHLIDKIGTCPTVQELDAMREAIRARGEELPGSAVHALARRRAELSKGTTT